MKSCIGKGKVDSSGRPRDAEIGLDGCPRVATVCGMNGHIYRELLNWLEGWYGSSNLDFDDKEI
jgi:hypothetical protein